MIPLRDENPTHITPVVTIFIILANIAIFLYQLKLGPVAERFIMQMAVIPQAITGNGSMNEINMGYSTLITSMFLHGGILHLIGNMWFLWIFGDNIEEFLGGLGFLIFYAFCGLAGSLTHIFFNAGSDIPTIGASGAISGVLGAYIILHPRIHVRTLLIMGIFTRIIFIPAVYFLGIWFAMQILGGMRVGGNIAYGAHIGGFIAGALLIILFSKKRRNASYHSLPRYESIRDPRWHHRLR